MSTLWEYTEAIKPPRVTFLDFPFGCTVGKPGEPALQRAILRAALDEVPRFDGPWAMRVLPFQWAEDGDRSWEEMVKNIYRRDSAKLGRSSDPQLGESLVGREQEFAIRCNC